jgi:hypothetical protein
MEHKVTQKGFSAVGIISIILALIVLGAIVWRVWETSQAVQAPESSLNQQNSSAQNTVPDGYAKYHDSANRFSFVYPSAWEVKDNEADREIISLIRPELKEAIEEGTGPSGTYFYEGALFSLVISHWNTISDMLDGEEFAGKRAYTNLVDFLDDSHTPKEKIGEITINGVQGYEVINPGIGSQYALLFERPDGIYQIEFSDVADKTKLTNKDIKIIDSFTFN